MTEDNNFITKQQMREALVKIFEEDSKKVMEEWGHKINHWVYVKGEDKECDCTICKELNEAVDTKPW